MRNPDYMSRNPSTFAYSTLNYLFHIKSRYFPTILSFFPFSRDIFLPVARLTRIFLPFSRGFSLPVARLTRIFLLFSRGFLLPVARLTHIFLPFSRGFLPHAARLNCIFLPFRRASKHLPSSKYISSTSIPNNQFIPQYCTS